MIFEDKERTRIDPKKPGEDEFAFYDSIAGAAYDVYRCKLNKWIAEYPDDERAEAIARFRKTGSLGYQAALAELLIHATLKRQGYSVEIHPACGHPSRRPDFLARDATGNAVAFVEVTSFGPPLEFVSRSKRDAAVMLLPKPHLWDLRTDRWQPQIVRNGSAERPLPAEFFPVPGFSVSAQGAVSQIEGTLMADLAGLPAAWPPEEPLDTAV